MIQKLDRKQSKRKCAGMYRDEIRTFSIQNDQISFFSLPVEIITESSWKTIEELNFQQGYLS